MRAKHLSILLAFIAWTSAFAAAALHRAKEVEFGLLMTTTAVVAFVAAVFAAFTYVDGNEKDDAWAAKLAKALDEIKEAEKDRDEWVERFIALEDRVRPEKEVAETSIAKGWRERRKKEVPPW